MRPRGSLLAYAMFGKTRSLNRGNYLCCRHDVFGDDSELAICNPNPHLYLGRLPLFSNQRQPDLVVFILDIVRLLSLYFSLLSSNAMTFSSSPEKPVPQTK